ncbi:MAG: hypothetical protein ACOY6K_10045 [Pseudomonadota bacterium]
MTTTYHLKFWSKQAGADSIERVYVNADDRSSLGYFEMRTTWPPAVAAAPTTTTVSRWATR